MTDSSNDSRALPLQGSPRNLLLWLIVLGMGVPTAAVLGVLGYAYADGAPAMPIVISGAFALAITLAVALWILGMMRRIGATLDDSALTVMTGIATRKFPLAALRAAGVRTVDLAEHVELRPGLRTWGIGMPGLASGWFRLRNGGKALCILTRRERVTVLKSDDGTWVLLSLSDASALRSALAAA
jgi:PH (Pleckstrin Homology) domain-containing protein